MPADRLHAPAPSCSDASRWLPAMVDGGTPVPPEVAAHTRTCLRCQAELARYRHLLRSLHALRAERIGPAPGALRDTLDAVAELKAARATRRVAVVAYIGGAVVATAASAAGMLVWATRRRVALAS